VITSTVGNIGAGAGIGGDTGLTNTGVSSANIGNSGSGTAHNTMHPFLVKRKLIKV
jgi:hypothetical protein